jgi:Flp pilus assembly protein TadG
VSSGQRPDRGSATVEFALVLPLVFLAALTVVQVGLLARDSLLVAHAAREGAREAAVTTEDAAVRDAVLARGALMPDRTTVDVQREGSAGEAVTVRITYRSSVVVPFVEWLFPQDVTLSAAATMRQEAAQDPL